MQEQVQEGGLRVATITITLTDDAAGALDEIAKAYGGISIEDALKRALGSGRMIAEETSTGGKILVRKKNHEVHELELE